MKHTVILICFALLHVIILQWAVAANKTSKAANTTKAPKAPKTPKSGEKEEEEEADSDGDLGLEGDGEDKFINDVSTPYTAATGPLNALKNIVVSGFIFPTSKRIIIDLESSGKDCKVKNYRCIIALHFDVRFFDDMFLLNTFRHGRWDIAEEHTPHTRFLKNDQRKFNIVVLDQLFLIIVDNTSIIYRHRVPLKTIKKVYVRGDIDLNLVEIKQWGGECEPSNPHGP